MAAIVAIFGTKPGLEQMLKRVRQEYHCTALYRLAASWFIAVLTAWTLATVVDRLVPVKNSTGVARTPAEVLSTFDGVYYAAIAST
jgi:hypothetical protein